MRDEPEAYTIGWIPFLGLKIYLDSRPLIPRPETEWWTQELAATLQKVLGSPVWVGPDFSHSRRQLRILDLCAGSGAIGCALLSALPSAHVSFGEIDPAHEATIRKNILENKLDMNRVEIKIGDLFEPFADERFDLVAANPPYIPDARALPASVAEFEPALALRAGPDGLDVIRRIAEALSKHLAPGGVAWIECDSEHATDAAELFRAEGFAAEVRNDQYERPRIIVARNRRTRDEG